LPICASIPNPLITRCSVKIHPHTRGQVYHDQVSLTVEFPTANRIRTRRLPSYGTLVPKSVSPSPSATSRVLKHWR
jgi:hypothetical protein